MPPEPTLDEKIVRVSAALTGAEVRHAFGGALALAYYAEPRATIDIDLNVFAPTDAARPALDALSGVGVAMDRRQVLRAVASQGQVRVRWGRTPLDLFFAVDHFHDACADGCRTVPFGNDTIPILAAEHLVVCKALYDRRKDWIDIEQVLFIAGDGFEIDEAAGWLARLVGADDARARRLVRLAGRFGAG